jgi:hypothetical protein
LFVQSRTALIEFGGIIAPVGSAGPKVQAAGNLGLIAPALAQYFLSKQNLGGIK